MSGWRRQHTVAVAVATIAVAGTLGAAPASATVTGQADVRAFGNSILVILQNIDSSTDTPAQCATVVFDAGDQPVITNLQEIYDGGIGIWFTTMPHETLHLAGQYTDTADYRVTTECRDDDGVAHMADTVVTLSEGDLVGNPPRYSQLFGAF